LAEGELFEGSPQPEPVVDLLWRKPGHVGACLGAGGYHTPLLEDSDRLAHRHTTYTELVGELLLWDLVTREYSRVEDRVDNRVGDALSKRLPGGESSERLF